ncbi:hypothetical protein O181_080018 [Austropuccinia psidii MF-1]|uniref:GAG-pre-integrase domain-containing protein n=1 Tax=Austropuccinia psidii MF-1 TaxID=1389203 RepID=A0A9Q3FHW1_9BASI|nr:hypothetical protein [Austropuccinia psidii MF-1]
MSLVKTEMTLSVASSQSFDVDVVGKIKLNTPDGVLYCKDIPGVILSVGCPIQEKFSISFINHHFTLSTSSITFNTHKRNNQWFIPFYLSHIKPLASDTSSHNVDLSFSSDISTLWHKQIGHLSIRQLSLMRNSNAATGITNVPFNYIKPCHDCSIEKKSAFPCAYSSSSANNSTR